MFNLLTERRSRSARRVYDAGVARLQMIAATGQVKDSGREDQAKSSAGDTAAPAGADAGARCSPTVASMMGKLLLIP
jgi:hypothetical protein